MKHLFLTLFAISSLLLCSCVREYIPHEVLQVSKFAKLYTAYNLWYTNPMEMTSENVQQGTIIPFGTEVVLTHMDENKICFEIDGKKFQIHMADKNLETVYAFTVRTFTTRTAHELAGISNAAEYEKMRRGVISEGMTEQQVLIAYGRPSITRSPNLKSNTWIYQIGPVKSRRVLLQASEPEKPRTVYRIFEL
ncbi:MAG: hypothetical protein IJW23_07855 [Lentisphaeria bacterium]|nr:hypothetical protein [Lentisphaeria bacterium]